MTEALPFTVTDCGGVSVIRFTSSLILDAYHVQQVTDALYDLIEKQQCCRLVVELSTIKMLSSQTLGVFLNMRQKLEPVGGRLTFSGINPQLYRVFKVTRLDSIFNFYETTDEAVASFSAQ